MNEKNLTTIDDLLAGYKEEDVELSTGKKFTIQSFTPGNLLIEIGSPIMRMLTESNEEDLRRMTLDYTNTNAGRNWSRIEQVVCDNVISVRFSPEPQNVLPTGLVSIQRLSLGEIQELYIKIRELSISAEEYATFRESYESDEGAEQPELDNEDSEVRGEESE